MSKGPASWFIAACLCASLGLSLGAEEVGRLLGGTQDVADDARLSPAGLIERWGYPVEKHDVETSDGFILEVDRIPGGRQSMAAADKKRPPVLLVHGGISSAADFLMNTPSQSPGFLLADNGFDVWLINTRGTPYSNRNKKLATNDTEFWNWSYDDIATYDLSATIDYILKKTDEPCISLLTWGQGFMEAMALLSLQTKYNDKVTLVVGMSPMANITSIKTPLRFMSRLATFGQRVINWFTKGSLMVSTDGRKSLISNLCNNYLRQMCFLPMTLLGGASQKQLNKTREPVYAAHIPSGTSTQNMVHYAQNYMAKAFQRFDYGMIQNLLKYLKTSPPEYALKKVTTKVALFTAAADRLADPTDVQDLREKISAQIVLDYEVPEKTFQHLDFVLGYDATDILHVPVMNVLKEYTSGEQCPAGKKAEKKEEKAPLLGKLGDRVSKWLG